MGTDCKSAPSGIDNRTLTTLTHELYHTLGLFHTHIDGTINDINQKYTFQPGHTGTPNPLGTDNIMSYNHAIRKTTWKWQWEITMKTLKRVYEK